MVMDKLGRLLTGDCMVELWSGGGQGIIKLLSLFVVGSSLRERAKISRRAVLFDC